MRRNLWNRRTLGALILLTATMARRLLRDATVVRSLMFPLALTTATLLATLGAVAVIRAPPLIAVPIGFHDPALAEALDKEGLALLEAESPRTLTAERRVRAGTDGTTVWAIGPTVEATLVESVLRRAHPEGWQLDPVLSRPTMQNAAVFGALIGRLLAAVFALYGVVFGAGMVARDRDDGTLASELALGIPRWVPGTARWLAASGVLAAFVVSGLLTWDALIGVPRLAAIARHAIAACTLATALGLYAVGRAHGRGAFAGPLAAALAFSFGLFALGWTFSWVADWVPIASLGGVGSGGAPLGLSLVAGGVLVALFSREPA